MTSIFIKRWISTHTDRGEILVMTQIQGEDGWLGEDRDRDSSYMVQAEEGLQLTTGS